MTKTTEENRPHLQATGSTEGNDVRLTPQDFFDSLDAEFSFTLDSCALPGDVPVDTGDDAPVRAGSRIANFYTPDIDALSKSGAQWYEDAQPNGAIWCNPPYGRAIPTWIDKCIEAADAGATVAMLIPSRTGSKWFTRKLLGKYQIRFVEGRLLFQGIHTNSKGEQKGITDPAAFDSLVAVIRQGDPAIYQIRSRRMTDRYGVDCKVYYTVDPETDEIVFDPRTVETSRFFIPETVDTPAMQQTEDHGESIVQEMVADMQTTDADTHDTFTAWLLDLSGKVHSIIGSNRDVQAIQKTTQALFDQYAVSFCEGFKAYSVQGQESLGMPDPLTHNGKKESEIPQEYATYICDTLATMLHATPYERKAINDLVQQFQTYAELQQEVSNDKENTIDELREKISELEEVRDELTDTVNTPDQAVDSAVSALLDALESHADEIGHLPSGLLAAYRTAVDQLRETPYQRSYYNGVRSYRDAKQEGHKVHDVYGEGEKGTLAQPITASAQVAADAETVEVFIEVDGHESQPAPASMMSTPVDGYDPNGVF